MLGIDFDFMQLTMELSEIGNDHPDLSGLKEAIEMAHEVVKVTLTRRFIGKHGGMAAPVNEALKTENEFIKGRYCDLVQEVLV